MLSDRLCRAYTDKLHCYNYFEVIAVIAHGSLCLRHERVHHFAVSSTDALSCGVEFELTMCLPQLCPRVSQRR